MARVTGPLFSMSASGQLGKAIVFTEWKGRPVVRAYAIPANPRSQAQRYTRSMMTFLSKAWTNLSAAEQAGWDAGAASLSISPFNEYVRVNMDYWKQQNGPIVTPGQAAGTDPVLGAITATYGVGQIGFSNVVTTANDIWALGILCRLGSAPASSLSYAMLVTEYTASPVTGTIYNLDAGTYYVEQFAITTGGSISYGNTDSGAVT